MAYVYLDDGFDEHPKVIRLSDPAFRLHVRAICYCNRRLTDGFVPEAFARGERPAVLEDLLAELWTPAPGGWVIHDYLDWNKSREQVETERQKARERRTKGGKRSADVRANIAPRSDDVHEPPPHPSTTQEVQDPKLIPAPSGATLEIAKPNPGQVPDRWQYFLNRLTEIDPRWSAVNFGALRRLEKLTSRDAVTTALGFASESPPDIESSPMGWLTTTARSVHGSREASA